MEEEEEEEKKKIAANGKVTKVTTSDGMNRARSRVRPTTPTTYMT